MSPPFGNLIAGSSSNRWNSVDLITRVRIPILLLSGRSDEIVPSRMMTELYSRAEHAKFRELAAFPKGRHNSTCLCRGYYEALRRFVDRVLEKPGGPDGDGATFML